VAARFRTQPGNKRFAALRDNQNAGFSSRAATVLPGWTRTLGRPLENFISCYDVRLKGTTELNGAAMVLVNGFQEAAKKSETALAGQAAVFSAKVKEQLEFWKLVNNKYSAKSTRSEKNLAAARLMMRASLVNEPCMHPT